MAALRRTGLRRGVQLFAAARALPAIGVGGSHDRMRDRRRGQGAAHFNSRAGGKALVSYRRERLVYQRRTGCDDRQRLSLRRSARRTRNPRRDTAIHRRLAETTVDLSHAGRNTDSRHVDASCEMPDPGFRRGLRRIGTALFHVQRFPPADGEPKLEIMVL